MTSLIGFLASCAGQGLAMGMVGQGVYEVVRFQSDKTLGETEGVTASEAAWMDFRNQVSPELFDRAVQCQAAFDRFLSRPGNKAHEAALRQPLRQPVADILREFIRKAQRGARQEYDVDAEFTREVA
jgi:hypothetical protein